jgi:hypothetical protein
MRQDRTTWARIGRTQGLSVRAGCCRCLAAGAELTRNLRGARRFAADSEKDPGYPFLAAPFQAAGIIRLAPLFYGALGCLGLFFGARRWLGRYGGPAAVVLFCSSGAALLFAWRDYMPTFTGASLIAAGTGALLWAVLAGHATARRRTWAGLAGFAALEAAVFVRYTGIVVLGCAVAAVAAAAKLRAVPGSALRWWLGSVAVSGAGVALSDDLVYGGPLTSGYRPGEITFSLAAVPTSLRYMPARLIAAMPMLVPGLAALAWIAGQRVRLRRAGQERAAPARRDLAVGLALAASWFSVRGLYAACTWTASPFGSTLAVHPVLRPRRRRHLAARQLAGDPPATAGIAGRGDLRRRRDVRAGAIGRTCARSCRRQRHPLRSDLVRRSHHGLRRQLPLRLHLPLTSRSSAGF